MKCKKMEALTRHALWEMIEGERTRVWCRTCASDAEHRLDKLIKNRAIRTRNKTRPKHDLQNCEVGYDFTKRSEESKTQDYTFLEKNGEDLENQGVLAQRSFTQKPHEW